MLFSITQAQTKTVTLQITGPEDIIEDGPRSEHPIINYDEGIVTISTKTSIYDATIVIKDNKGEIIHQEQTIVSPAKAEIKMSPQELTKKAEVEVYYDDKCLRGYFEE